MSDQEFGTVLNAHNMPSPTAVKSVSAIGQAQATPQAAGTITNGQDRNGSSMGPPSTGMTPVSDPTKKPSSGSSSSSSKDPSRHKDGHKSSSGHHGSSASKSNGDSSHSKDHHKHSSSHSSSSSSSRPHSSSGSATKEQDKHRVSSSSTSSSSAHKDKEHSKSKDHHSSSASKSHSSSSSSGDKSHGSSKKPDGSSSSSSKPKEDSSKSKHGSSSSSSHKASDGKDKDRHHSSKSSSSDKPRDKSHSSSSSVKPSLSMESASNVSVKMEGSSIKMKIEMSPSKTSTTQDVKTPVVKTEPHLPPVKVKVENPLADYTDDDDEDELPLSERMKVKPEPVNSAKRKRADSDEDSDTPLSERKKKVKSEPVGKKRKLEDDDFKPKKNVKPSKTAVKMEDDESVPKRGKKAKVEEEEHNWRWWEEETKEEGVKWKTLEHKGPVFAPPYEPLPANVKFYYDGKVINLSPEAEEIAGFYARMLDHDYTTRDLFNNNFLKDWRKKMTPEERSLITNLSKCNFREYYDYFKIKTEERKGMSKEEKLVIKKENERLQKEYGFCIIDGHKQKIGNFKIEPPGLFRGRGDHPKQGMLKQRVVPEDVMINCSKGSNVPAPPPGHKWKEVRHDNTVTWLASWTENVQGQNKYVMLNAASKLKGEKDWNKYETARKLHKLIHKIRNTYKEDWKSKEMRIRQRSVALYFIDKLALRAGNEKDEDTADTVGCCSLRVEHIKLHEKYDDQECVVEFDFLGKDSIRYYNRVPVEKRVFKNLQLFVDNKQGNDDLFDRLNTGILNKHLQTLMDGLTAKVFRTYNASHTLQQQLDLLSQSDDFGDEPIAAKILAYNRANRAVAILCNHQRAAPKNFDKQMENLQSKIDAKNELIKNAKKELKDAKTDAKHSKSETTKANVVKKEKALERLKEQLGKLEVQATDKDENKEIALGTSKLNYLDPRISIAWCKKWDVPIEKVYNKTQREKFAWAISMATADYQF